MDLKSRKYLHITIPLVLGVLGFAHLIREQQEQLRRFEDLEQELEVQAASAIKVWTTSETIRATDLNSNFSHIHGTMVGGHGARLVNADVSASAAISHSKMETPALVPRAWATVGVGAACTGVTAAGTACTVNASSKVTSVVTSGTAGTYRVTLNYTPTDANFSVSITPGTADRACYFSTLQTAAPHFLVVCQDLETPAVTDPNTFTFHVWDD